MRSRGKSEVAESPEKEKWINAMAARLTTELPLQEKIDLILTESIPLEVIKDPELLTLLDGSIGAVPLEILDSLNKLSIPEEELRQILQELPNLSPKEQKDLIQELSEVD